MAPAAGRQVCVLRAVRAGPLCSNGQAPPVTGRLRRGRWNSYQRPRRHYHEGVCAHPHHRHALWSARRMDGGALGSARLETSTASDSICWRCDKSGPVDRLARALDRGKPGHSAQFGRLLACPAPPRPRATPGPRLYRAANGLARRRRTRLGTFPALAIDLPGPTLDSTICRRDRTPELLNDFDRLVRDSQPR